MHLDSACSLFLFHTWEQYVFAGGKCVSTEEPSRAFHKKVLWGKTLMLFHESFCWGGWWLSVGG